MMSPRQTARADAAWYHRKAAEYPHDPIARAVCLLGERDALRELGRLEGWLRS